MKKLLIALGLILVLAGIAAGIMAWQGIGPFADMAWLESEEEVDEETAAKAALPRFVQLDPLAVPLIKDNKVIGNIQLLIKLEAVSIEAMRVISKGRPRLSDAFLRDLHQYIPRQLRREPQIDIVDIKKRLKAVADRVLGPGKVKEVLVQGVVENTPR